jgi:hypothetical protein
MRTVDLPTAAAHRPSPRAQAPSCEPLAARCGGTPFWRPADRRGPLVAWRPPRLRRVACAALQQSHAVGWRLSPCALWPAPVAASPRPPSWWLVQWCCVVAPRCPGSQPSRPRLILGGSRPPICEVEVEVLVCPFEYH